MSPADFDQAALLVLWGAFFIGAGFCFWGAKQFFNPGAGAKRREKAY